MENEQEELELLRLRKKKSMSAPKESKLSPMQMIANEAIKGFSQGGPLGAGARGVVEAGKQGLKKYDELAYEAGGKVTDIASGMGASPKTSALLGGSANIGLNMFPLGGVAKLGAKTLGLPMSWMAKRGAEELMGSALKPSASQWAKGEGKIAVDTMLDKGLTVSNKSVAKLNTELEGLQKQVSDALAKSNATVPKADVVKTIEEAKKFFKGGTSEVQDMQVIKDVIKEFEKAPSVKGMKDIPVQVAQRMKVLENRRINKGYGTLGDAEETARKGTARGLKEGINKVVPEVQHLNAAEKQIYDTLPVLERRAMMEINRNPAGLAALAHNPATAAAMMLDKSSAFKSWLANKLNMLTKTIPGTAQSAADIGGEAGAISLYEMGKKQ